MTEAEGDDDDNDDSDDVDDEVVSDEDELTDDETETENVEGVLPTSDPRHLVKDYRFRLTEFNLLTERLGYQMKDFIIKLDLLDGYLAIRAVPGSPHGVYSRKF